MSGNGKFNFRVGEWVEVRSAEEILATLDDKGCLDGLPFMPEMLRFCGSRFRIYKSAHKTADTIELFTIRKMNHAVHLDELRCDGSAHGGCQAGCLLFWKDAWLNRVSTGQNKSADARPAVVGEGSAEKSAAWPRLLSSTRLSTAPGQPERYRCQATEMLAATSEVRRRERWTPSFYLRDLTSGNVGLWDFIRFGALATLNAFLRRWFGFSFPRIQGSAPDKTPTGELKLQAGELVRVKPKRKIEQTLNRQQKNRGLWFDAEMVPYCNKGPFRVLQRVERIVNEKTGEMMVMGNPCIVLDGVTCSGNYLYQRMFSPRSEHMYFREIWLERVGSPPAAAEAGQSGAEHS
jgi:hypothetical protein